jgi:hypothetical protein
MKSLSGERWRDSQSLSRPHRIGSLAAGLRFEKIVWLMMRLVFIPVLYGVGPQQPLPSKKKLNIPCRHECRQDG